MDSGFYPGIGCSPSVRELRSGTSIYGIGLSSDRKLVQNVNSDSLDIEFGLLYVEFGLPHVAPGYLSIGIDVDYTRTLVSCHGALH